MVNDEVNDVLWEHQIVAPQTHRLKNLGNQVSATDFVFIGLFQRRKPYHVNAVSKDGVYQVGVIVGKHKQHTGQINLDACEILIHEFLILCAIGNVGEDAYQFTTLFSA